MPQTATETALPDRATIATVALKAYNTWAGLPTLQQMSFNHPSLGEMIADAVLAATTSTPRPITDEQVEAAAKVIDPDAWLLNPTEYRVKYLGAKSRPGRVRSSIIKARAALEAARGCGS